MKKRKKEIGKPLPGPGCIDDLGEVIAIPLGDEYWGYLRRCKDASGFILSSLSQGKILTLEEVKGSDVISSESFTEPWDTPTWIYLGNWPFEEQDEVWEAPKWSRDVLNPQVIKIYCKGEFTYTKDENQVKGMKEDKGLCWPGHLVESIRVAHGLPVSREEIEQIAPFTSNWHGFRNLEEEQQFYPFQFTNQFCEYQLMFCEWDWLREKYETDTIDDFYLNGHSVQALIQATRIINDLPVKKRGVRYNSEGDCCRIEFRTKKEAILTAKLALEMISDINKLRATIKCVEDSDLDY